MVNKFLAYISVEKKYSEKTVQAYHDDIRDFCKYMKWEVENFNPEQVDESDIRDWMMEMMDSGQSPKSVKRRLAAMRSFYKFMLRVGIIDRDVTRRIVSPKVDKPLPVFFKESEMERATMFDEQADDYVSVRDSLIIEMLYQTGMRQAELLGLKDADVDTAQGQVRVFGKRKKERVVPIGEQLCSYIEKYRELRNFPDGRPTVARQSPDSRPTVARGSSVGHPWVARDSSELLTPSPSSPLTGGLRGASVAGNLFFPDLTKSRLYRIVVSRMGEVSTLKKHSPHVLRHTFATTMLNNGADIRTIQTLLGHASLAATQVYTHTTFEQIREAYDKAHPRGKSPTR